ncbi:hypothetical protein AALO_G00134290 [Alosa alosa]|uniref:Uncharacterized protein n=1 Tax=Alosa alosa TaxID=278164 RepID=A0AAV6GKD9_9TELE|nr:hypothetical protein AALO_G00134290 [Alosa alosa]
MCPCVGCLTVVPPAGPLPASHLCVSAPDATAAVADASPAAATARVRRRCVVCVSTCPLCPEAKATAARTPTPTTTPTTSTSCSSRPLPANNSKQMNSLVQSLLCISACCLSVSHNSPALLTLFRSNPLDPESSCLLVSSSPLQLAKPLYPYTPSFQYFVVL